MLLGESALVVARRLGRHSLAELGGFDWGDVCGCGSRGVQSREAHHHGQGHRVSMLGSSKTVKTKDVALPPPRPLPVDSHKMALIEDISLFFGIEYLERRLRDFF